MIQVFNYTELIEYDGRKRLFDPALYEKRMNQVEKLRQSYNDIHSFLAGQGLPADWTKEVAEGGVEALCKLIRKNTRQKAEYLELPAAVVDSWCRMAIAEIVNDDNTTRIRDLEVAIARVQDGLPLTDSDINVSEEGVTINTDSLAERIRLGCSREVNPKDEANANRVLELAKQVEKLEYEGINARELINRYVSAKKEPTEFELLRDIVTRTHRVGCLNTDYSYLNCPQL